MEEKLDKYELGLKLISERILSEKKLALVETRRKIERDFTEWLKTMNPTDPENIKILKRVRHFEVKIQEWRIFGKNQDKAREQAMDELLDQLYQVGLR